jgi:CheY-like chemotaxis protein
VRLFTPFTQGDTSFARRYGGTGLGLSISKALVLMLGGTLELESQPGRGTSCRFTVRARRAAAAAGAPAPAREAPAIPTGLDVLLAEDGRDNQRLISHYLRQLDARVTVVENGGEAIRVLTERMACGQSFDVVLMDIQMPQVDGHEATRQIRTAGYRGPILALTAHAMSGHREQCLASGCDEFLTKPIVRRDLISAIANLLQQPRPAPGS